METKAILGFKGLDFKTGLDEPTNGTLTFVIKDHSANADRHALLLGKLVKSSIVLSLENDKFSISIREPNNGNTDA